MTFEAVMRDKRIRTAFGARLKALRNQRGWTQKELAAKLGVVFAQLNKYESGLHIPPAEKLILLAQLFDTTLDYLLIGDSSDQRPLNNTRLLERFRALEGFGAHDLDVVVELIDAMIAKRRIEDVLKPADLRAARGAGAKTAA